jgi:hypothetical protein
MLADRRPRTRSSVEPRPIDVWLAERDGTED